MINRCYFGDVRDGLRAFIAVGIKAQTCVTSPPYWGLRDYGTAEWEGGEGDCDHSSTRRNGSDVDSFLATKQATSCGSSRDPIRRDCRKCGARRIDRQIGLEPTIAEYVATMVEVFGLVRDVLTDDGTLWLNLGDSYATGAGKVGNCPGGGDQGARWRGEGSKHDYGIGPVTQPNRLPQEGLKPKDLCGIPWRVAFALQADGWYLRSDIIWAKPNPMPESVTDRPTKAHEYLFLITKQERYFYDAAAIFEPAAAATYLRLQQNIEMQMGSDRVPGKTNGRMKAVGRGRGGGHKTGQIGHVNIAANAKDLYLERNRRSVWTVTTQPFSEAHFAVMPTALVEPCILAGSRPGDIVLDPFMGSGTVAKVAQSLGRRWIGCELNPAYVAMQRTRAAQIGMELHP